MIPDDTLLRCPGCGFVGGYDDFDVMGCDEGCLWCNRCHLMDPMEVIGPDVTAEDQPCA